MLLVFDAGFHKGSIAAWEHYYGDETHIAESIIVLKYQKVPGERRRVIHPWAVVLYASGRRDASPIVRGVAVASYLKVAGDAALLLARSVVAEQSWRNVLRTPALTVLKGMHVAAVQSLYHECVK